MAFCFASSSDISSPVSPLGSELVRCSEKAPSYINPEYSWKFSSKLLKLSWEILSTCCAKATVPFSVNSSHLNLPWFKSSDNWFSVFSNSTLYPCNSCKLSKSSCVKASSYIFFLDNE